MIKGIPYITYIQKQHIKKEIIILNKGIYNRININKIWNTYQIYYQIEAI